jgi:predicted DNA-binding transcriptional regulator AlpA
VGRKLDVDWLVTTTEIYRFLRQRGRSNVEWWMRHDDAFPPSVTRLGAMHVWYWPDVARWAIAAGRLPKGAERIPPVTLLADTAELSEAGGRHDAGRVGSRVVQTMNSPAARVGARRKLDVDYLVTTTDIHHLLGRKRVQTVHWWINHDDTFPPPLTRLGKMLVWYWPDIARWAIAAGRIPKGAERVAPATLLADRRRSLPAGPMGAT